MKYINSYQNFIVENLDMAKSIMRKKNEAFEKLKSLLGKNIGYIGKFTEYLYHENIPYSELEKLYQDLLFLKSKNASFDIQELKYEKVIDKIDDTKNNLIVKSLVDQFPSEQKKLAREELVSEKEEGYATFKNTLLKAARKENTQAFISKVSRYKDIESLSTALEIFGKDAKNEKVHVLEYVESSPTATVVYDDKNYLIIKIDDIKDVQHLGSDTSWCILRDSQWKSYTKNRHQYILYDYNKEEFDVDFKIGFTVDKEGVKYAHDILDGNCVWELKSILSNVGLKASELFPDTKIDSPLNDEEIDKINYRTNTETLRELSDRCQPDKAIKLINRLILLFHKVRNNKKGQSVSNRICELLKMCYRDKEFIYENELLEINSGIMTWIRNNSRMEKKIIYNHPVFDSDFSDNILIENFKHWSDVSIASMQTRGLYEDFNKRSVGTLEIIFNRLDSIYKNPKIIFNNTIGKKLGSAIKNKHLKGYKLSYPFELCYLLYGLKLNKDIKDKEKIIEHLPKNQLDEIVEYVDVPIDLDFISTYRPNLSDRVIKNVIKKDYPNLKINIDRSSYKQCLKLIDHLKGHKMSFRISKRSLGEMKRFHSEDNNIIMKILYKFRTVRLITNTVMSEGDLSIRVY